MDWYDFLFAVEVLVGGLLSGVMYSLVAIGFVLIYKTSGVLKLRAGRAMVLFVRAHLRQPRRTRRGVPAALAATLLIMTALGFAIERTVLRPLVKPFAYKRSSWRRSGLS